MKKNKLELMLEQEKNELKIAVLEDVLNNGDFDECVTYMKNVLQYGCISGTVTMLIYYNDTHNFFDKYYDEIMNLVEEYEEQLGEKLEWENDLKNWFAWFAYEETVRNIMQELEIEY